MLDIKKLESIPVTQKHHLSRTCKIILSRKSFYFFCKTLFPNIYNNDRLYLKDVCNDLQRFFEDKIIMPNGKPARFLHLNIPPRFYKSFTIGLFEAWTFGINHKNQCITACYSKELALLFARNVRNHITQLKKRGVIVYADIFPKTFLKRGHTAVGEWALAGSHMSFKATSFGGSLTGFGTNSLFVIDDQINDAKDAGNEVLLAENWSWFRNTMFSRIEKGGKLIVNMTRWSDNDMCGRMLQLESMRNMTHVIKYPVVNELGELLCSAVMDYDTLVLYMEALDPSIFSATYKQNPINEQNKLFRVLRTYTKEELKFNINDVKLLDIRAVIDPCKSKGGSDYYSIISYIVYKGDAFVNGIFYKNRSEEITDKEVARFLIENNVKSFRVELNVNDKLCEDILKSLKNDFEISDIKGEGFTSQGVKIDRIRFAAPWIQRSCFFPEKWDILYPLPYNNILSFQYPGKNKNDDFEDCLSFLKEDVHNNGLKMGGVYAKVIPRNQYNNIEDRYFYG